MRSLAGVDSGPIQLAPWFWHVLAGAVLLIALLRTVQAARQKRRELQGRGAPRS